MPIRSPRGRAAAYRWLWQWPLRSPARLLVVVALVVAAGAGVGVALGGSGGPNPGLLPGDPGITAATGAAEPTRSSGPRASATPPPPVPALTPAPLPLSAAPPGALEVAGRWAAAWVDHPAGTTSEQWLAGLSDLTTPEYLPTLRSVDPANVPASAVTGSPRAVRVAPRSVEVEVPLDTLALHVVVVETDAGWRVTEHGRG